MTRALLALLLLAAAALAGEDAAAAAARVRTLLDAGRPVEALPAAEAALAAHPGDKLLSLLRAQATCGIAQELQRAEGYEAAIDWLEPRLDHWVIAEAYANACLWGGEEERGLAGLAACAVPEDQRAGAEMRLLQYLYRYDEAAALARRVGWPEAEAWALEQAAPRARLHARARRALKVALVAGGLLALAAVALYRLAPPARPA